MLARIINGQLHQGLPQNGTLTDGRTVSNYGLLPLNILTNEGWKEILENHAVLQDGKYEVVDTFLDDGVNIVINYKTEII